MFSPKQIFARINRGIILDAIVLVVNTLLMTVLSSRLAALFAAHIAKEPAAEVATFFYIAALCILPGVAAFFKLLAGNRFKPSEYEAAAYESFPMFLKLILLGQLVFHTLFIVVLFVTRSDLLDQTAGEPLVSWVFLVVALVAILVVIVYPIFTYFHFFVDTTYLIPSRFRLAAELAADLCLFANLILYQAYWGLLMNGLPNEEKNIVGRLSLFLFSAAMIYLPPRIYYLADDGGRLITWAMILLANSPVLTRIFFF